MAARREGGQLRAARREFGDVFGTAAEAHAGGERFRAAFRCGRDPGSALARLPEPILARVLAQAFPQAALPTWRGEGAAARAQVFVRKRPLAEWERAEGDYDVVSCLGGALVLHDGRLRNNGRELHMIHRRYRCTAVYDDFADNDEVYAQTTAPLVRWVMLGADGRESGRRAGTVVLFGQTGTGKTFTAQAVQQRAAEELFAGLATVGTGEARVELSFYEMCGSSFFDLLNARAPLSVLTDGEGHVHVRGASSRAVSSAAALQEAAEEGFLLRRSNPTERNAVSSRSHAFLELRILQRGEQRGRLCFVDLAGSERNYETQQHSAAFHKESAEINKGLMTLKDCFRMLAVRAQAAAEAQAQAQAAAAATAAATFGNRPPARGDAPPGSAEAEAQGRGSPCPVASPRTPPRASQEVGEAPSIRVPFRNSRLTMLLRACFTDPDHRTSVIATISPTSTDLEHSRNTLDHAVMMGPGLQEQGNVCDTPVPLPQVEEPVGKWPPERARAWLKGAEEGIFSHLRLADNVGGRDLLRLTPARLRSEVAGGDKNLGDLLFKAIRAEVARVEALHKAHRERWVRARNRTRSVLAKPVLADTYAALEVPLHSAAGAITEAPGSPGPLGSPVPVAVNEAGGGSGLTVETEQGSNH